MKGEAWIIVQNSCHPHIFLSLLVWCVYSGADLGHLDCTLWNEDTQGLSQNFLLQTIASHWEHEEEKNAMVACGRAKFKFEVFYQHSKIWRKLWVVLVYEQTILPAHAGNPSHTHLHTHAHMHACMHGHTHLLHICTAHVHTPTCMHLCTSKFLVTPAEPYRSLKQNKSEQL